MNKPGPFPLGNEYTQVAAKNSDVFDCHPAFTPGLSGPFRM